jgi:hypothetical protein
MSTLTTNSRNLKTNTKANNPNIGIEDTKDTKITLCDILNTLSDILKDEIGEYNIKALSYNYDTIKAEQDFTNLNILEAGNEYLYEQYCFKNKIDTENRCKRLCAYDLYPDNLALQEYKDKISGGLLDKNNKLLYITLNNLLTMYEGELKYSFNLMNQTVQDTLFTTSILKLKQVNKDYNTILEDIIKSGLNIFIKQMVYNHSNIRDIFIKLFTKYKEFMDSIISRLDNIPHIEQKTDEWFAMRENMISASICGYIDGYVSGAGLSKEHEKIKEKANMSSKKVFSMSSAPLKHGILFEDVTGDIYNSINNLVSKEYGILPDYRHKCIGASPDGIVTDLKYKTPDYANNDVLSLFKYGRMREIKNPVSRNIVNGSIPNYYYYQMLQQMYVCDLPYCDFIQADITYPPTNCNEDKQRMNKFLTTDTLDIEYITSITKYSNLENLIARYILNKINWWNGIIINDELNNILTMDVKQLEPYIVSLLVNDWNNFIDIPLENLNISGRLKGIFWYYTKGYRDNLEYKYIWLPVNEIYSSSSINNISKVYLQKWVDEGYKLEDKYYYVVNEYMETEIQYNQILYDNILSRLLKRWDTVETLRAITNIDTRLEEYKKLYPMDGNRNYMSTFNSMFKTATTAELLTTSIDTTESLLGLNTKNNNKKRKAKLKTKQQKALELVNVANSNGDDDIYDLN